MALYRKLENVLIAMHYNLGLPDVALVVLRLNWVNSFSTRRLSSCTDEYAHTYDISTLISTAVIV